MSGVGGERMRSVFEGCLGSLVTAEVSEKVGSVGGQMGDNYQGNSVQELHILSSSGCPVVFTFFS